MSRRAVSKAERAEWEKELSQPTSMRMLMPPSRARSEEEAEEVGGRRGVKWNIASSLSW